MYNVAFIKREKRAALLYTELPVLPVNVGTSKQKILTQKTVTCALGGVSIPISISYDAVPYTNVVVSLAKVEVEDTEGATDFSAGITPSDTKLTLTASNPSGMLSFECAADTTGTKLIYVLEGTDKDYFEFSEPTIMVEAIELEENPEEPVITLTLDELASTSRSLTVNA